MVYSKQRDVLESQGSVLMIKCLCILLNIDTLHSRHSIFKSNPYIGEQIREIPDHATFREKEHTLGWLDKLGVFSLWPYVIWTTLTTNVLQSIYIMIILEYENNSMEYLLFLNMNVLGLHMFHIF